MYGKPDNRLLDPPDRISEVLFGLIMVLTSTNGLNAITAGRSEIGTMIVGALGCNLAWGIIDAALYLMGSLAERGRNLLTVRSARQASSPEQARRLMADVLPEPLASVLSDDDAESMRQKLLQLPEPPARPSLTNDDALGARVSVGDRDRGTRERGPGAVLDRTFDASVDRLRLRHGRQSR